MKVAVTGGAGFIGSHIVEELLAHGCEVHILDNLSGGKKENLHPQAQFTKIDIRSPELDEWFCKHKPEYVIHHAAQINVTDSIRDPLLDADINISGTIRLLQCCAAYGVKKIVYASSAAVYGNPQYLPIDESHPVHPLSPYGISKYVPEHYLRIFCELHGLRFTVLRYANVYGPRQEPHGDGGVVAIFVRKALAGASFPIQGDGTQTRDFIFVQDIARANRLALYEGDGEVLNISWGKPVSIHELMTSINRVAGRTLDYERQPPRPGDIKDSYLSSAKARELLGWEPRFTLEDGLRLTFKSLEHEVL